MFCTSLRRRPSIAALIPTLVSASPPTLRESHLETHDLTLPLSTTPPRTLRLLLLTPSSAASENVPGTMSRIDHLVHLTGGQDVAVIFLLTPPVRQANRATVQPTSDTMPTFVSAKTLTLPEDTNKSATGFQAYVALQSSLLTHTGPSSIPSVPLVEHEDLLDLLKDCQRRFSQPQAHTPQLPITANELLRESISGCSVPPQGQTDRNGDAQFDPASVIQHVFGNLQEFVEWCVTSGEMEQTSAGGDEYGDVQMTNGEEDPGVMLRDILGDEQVAEVKAWWKEEWIAD